MIVPIAPPTYPASLSSASGEESTTQVEYLTVPEASERSGKSVSTINRWVRTGKLPALENPRRVSASDIERMISRELQDSHGGTHALRALWKRTRGWFMRKPALHAVILGVLVTVIGSTLGDPNAGVSGFLLDKYSEATDYDPKPIIDNPSSEVPWIRFRYDPEKPEPDRSGLRMDICTSYRYYTVESWQILPDGQSLNLYPATGALPTPFRVTASPRCGEVAPGDTIEPRWPATRLNPGDVIRISVSLLNSEGLPAADYQYTFVMGERDITGGRV